MMYTLTFWSWRMANSQPRPQCMWPPVIGDDRVNLWLDSAGKSMRYEETPHRLLDEGTRTICDCVPKVPFSITRGEEEGDMRT